MNLEELRRRKTLGHELTDEEFEFLNKFWQSGVRSNPLRKAKYKLGAQYKDSPFNRFVPPSEVKSETATLKCTFCGKHVERVDATTGKVSRFSKRERLVSTDPELEFEEKIFASNQKVVACPNCCLKIDKPDIDSLEG